MRWSPHAARNQEPRVATERLLKAIAHPLVHVIGHPTGRIVNGRSGLEPAMNELYAAAKEHGTALEIARLHFRYGVLAAQRGWLPKAQCLNCLTAKALDAWRKKKR